MELKPTDTVCWNCHQTETKYIKIGQREMYRKVSWGVTDEYTAHYMECQVCGKRAVWRDEKYAEWRGLLGLPLYG